MERKDMDSHSVISANELFAEDPSDFFVDMGLPNYNRRLTDKILAAFNHAYSVGEFDLAESLRELLIEAEKRGQQQFPGRRPNQAQEQADRWVEFVEARERYREAEQATDIDPETKAELLKEMRDSYQRWSAG